jgi:hypothetical protein
MSLCQVKHSSDNITEIQPALDLNKSHSFSHALDPQVLPYTSTQNALKCYPLLLIMNSRVGITLCETPRAVGQHTGGFHLYNR